MHRLWQVNRAVIVAFAVMSGLYKLGFGAADIEIYAHIHYTAGGTAVFGAIQAACGLSTFHPRTRPVGAASLACCNAVATTALFAADIQPFGWVSWLFVLMALAVVVKPEAG